MKQQQTNLASVAQAHNLAAGTVHRLQALCAEFKSTPEKEKGSRSKAQQRDAMQAIRDRAGELKRLLDDLPNGECMRLDSHLWELGVPEAEHAAPLFARAPPKSGLLGEPGDIRCDRVEG